MRRRPIIFIVASKSNMVSGFLVQYMYLMSCCDCGGVTYGELGICNLPNLVSNLLEEGDHAIVHGPRNRARPRPRANLLLHPMNM